MKLEKMKAVYTAACQKIGAAVHAPSKKQGQAMLFTLGVALIVGGVAAHVEAQGVPSASVINYNDGRVVQAARAVLAYLEGSFGALVMVCSGVGAILSAAFGQYRAALGLMVVAIGAFILRSLVSTFFNATGIDS